jgi:septal ring factor EnvC (AmiA/AmiB activator)
MEKSNAEMMAMYLDRLRKRERALTEDLQSITGGLAAVRELIADEEAKLADAQKEPA